MIPPTRVTGGADSGKDVHRTNSLTNTKYGSIVSCTPERIAMLYRMHEASFDISDELHDQSVNVFTATPSGPSPFNIVVTRSSVEPDTDLKLHVDNELATMQQTLTGYKLLWRNEHIIDGRPAVIAGSSLPGPPAMQQRQIFLIEGACALTISASAAGEFTPEQLLTLNRLAQTFQFQR